MLFYAPPPPPPVSYSREVAPIFALHCNGCHGDAGGLSTRTWRDLMAGGHLGRIIVPGDPDRSLLVHFIDGRRGKEQLMPLGGRPLTAEQIGTIRRWIAEGAKQDADNTERHVRKLPRVYTAGSRLFRITWGVSEPCYVTLSIRDPENGRVLLGEVFSLKAPRERVDAGEPGDLLTWEVRPAGSWPETIDVELVVSYAEREPRRIELSVKLVAGTSVQPRAVAPPRAT